jgi:uncharacterized membrane protein
MDGSSPLMADEMGLNDSRERRGSFSRDDYLLVAGVVFAGLLSGLYFIFSVCVMWALGAVEPELGARVMAEINVVIINGYFISVFMIGPLVCAGVLVDCFYNNNRENGKSGASSSSVFWLKIVGALLLIVGEFGVTAGLNVPLNNELQQIAKDDGAKKAGVFFTEQYLGPWTAWNSVRCAASVGTVLCFSLALRLK